MLIFGTYRTEILRKPAKRIIIPLTARKMFGDTRIDRGFYDSS